MQKIVSIEDLERLLRTYNMLGDSDFTYSLKHGLYTITSGPRTIMASSSIHYLYEWLDQQVSKSRGVHKRLNVNVAVGLHNALARECKRTGTSGTEVIEKLLIEHLNKSYK